MAGPPELVVVIGQEEQHGAGEEEQEQEQPLSGSTAQGEKGHTAVPGGWQAGERDPMEPAQRETPPVSQ